MTDILSNGEFQNKEFDDFCVELGIVHEYSAPKTPQQNGVVEPNQPY